MKIFNRLTFAFGFAVTLLAATSCNDDDVTVLEPTAEYTVVTFNIRYNKASDAYPWAVRRLPVANMWADVNPDIVCLQEPDADQLGDLIEDQPDYDFITVPVPDGLTYDSTGSIMIAYRHNRFDVLDSGYFWQSETPGQPSKCWAATDLKYRTTVWAHVKDIQTGKDFFVFTAQQSANNQDADRVARLNATMLNLKQMQAIAGRHKPVLFMGDMNASGDATDNRNTCITPYYEWMWGARDKSPITDTKYSFNSFGSRALTIKDNLDHIFYRLVTPLEFRTIDDGKPYGVDYLSRHNPLVFKFEL